MSNNKTFAEVATTRRSIRAFLDKPVPEAELESIFSLAQTAPSNCNTQPWHVHVVSGEALERLRKLLPEALFNGEFSMDFPYEGKYSGVYKARQYDAANQLYASMGIAREEKDKRNAAFMRNFEFFGAPHVVFLFMHEDFGLREAADVGMYAQNLMLSMQAHDVASCPQTALAFHADKVRDVLAIDVQWKLLFGISFGYEDVNAAVNAAKVDRAVLSDAVSFHR
ncbi:MAG: nitroreductase family protein [Pseudomonadales bacterium]|nr:nitroreductase family protein [Pseudomonadales bacterium]